MNSKMQILKKMIGEEVRKQTRRSLKENRNYTANQDTLSDTLAEIANAIIEAEEDGISTITIMSKYNESEFDYEYKITAKGAGLS
jgi:hypothetical protein